MAAPAGGCAHVRPRAGWNPGPDVTSREPVPEISGCARASPGQPCPLVTLPVTAPSRYAGGSGAGLGTVPDPASLPPLPSFNPADGSSAGRGVLAAAAAASEQHDGRSGDSDPAPPVSAALHAAGPYNPAPEGGEENHGS